MALYFLGPQLEMILGPRPLPGRLPGLRAGRQHRGDVASPTSTPDAGRLGCDLRADGRAAGGRAQGAGERPAAAVFWIGLNVVFTVTAQLVHLLAGPPRWPRWAARCSPRSWSTRPGAPRRLFQWTGVGARGGAVPGPDRDAGRGPGLSLAPGVVSTGRSLRSLLDRPRSPGRSGVRPGGALPPGVVATGRSLRSLLDRPRSPGRSGVVRAGPCPRGGLDWSLAALAARPPEVAWPVGGGLGWALPSGWSRLVARCARCSAARGRRPVGGGPGWACGRSTTDSLVGGWRAGRAVIPSWGQPCGELHRV